VLEQFEEMAADDPWDEISTLNRSRLWLTRAEAEAFAKELTDVIERYRKGRTASSHPGGARPVSALLAVVPTGKAPEES
jgi:hypothetical protein